MSQSGSMPPLEMLGLMSGRFQGPLTLMLAQKRMCYKSEAYLGKENGA